MENNKWKELWQNRSVETFLGGREKELLEKESFEELFLGLKSINGFDVLEEGVTFSGFFEQYKDTKRELEGNRNFLDGKRQIFEIGCGSGANLLLFPRMITRLGG